MLQGNSRISQYAINADSSVFNLPSGPMMLGVGGSSEYHETDDCGVQFSGEVK